MKNRSTKVLALALLFILIAGTVLPGFADEEAPYLITGSGILWVGSDKTPVVAAYLPSDATSFSVTTSNKAVLKVGKQEGFGPYGWWMKPVKAGKATITLKYKSGGKTKKVSGTFKVKNYPDPFEWIKINGKKIDMKKNRCNAIIQNYRKDKITVSFKLKSGWKVTDMGGFRIKGSEWLDVTWKNNKAISLKGYDAADLMMDLKNTKTGTSCTYEVVVSR